MNTMTTQIIDLICNNDPEDIDEIILLGKNKHSISQFDGVSKFAIDSLVDFIRKCKHLRKFVMLYFNIRPTLWSLIFDALMFHKIEILDMSTNAYTTGMFNALEFSRNALSDLSCIQSLNLSNTWISYRDSNRFLRKTTTLEELKLNNMYYNNGDITILADAIARNRSIKYLSWSLHVPNVKRQQIVLTGIARNCTIRTVSGLSKEEHNTIKTHRDAIRHPLMKKLQILINACLIPAEISEIIAMYMDIPVVYQKWNKK